MKRALDIEQPAQLTDYLRECGHLAPDEQVQARVLTGGVSNRTVLVERQNGEAWVLKQALTKLRVPTPWFSSPERVHREALGLRWLSRLLPADSVPDFLFEDYDHDLFAMRAVPEPHSNWKQLLLSGEIAPNCVTEFGRLLRTLHESSRRNRSELETLFSDTTFFEALRLEPYYSYTAGQIPGARSFLEALVQETQANRTSLVHGDYSPKNILVRNGRLVLLDHEVIHWGDPAFDLGFSLAHLLSKAHWLVSLRTRFREAAALYWLSYGDAGFEARAVRHTLGCLLARAAGRSPLEYLNEKARTRQVAVVLRLLARPPARVLDLIERFCSSDLTASQG